MVRVEGRAGAFCIHRYEVHIQDPPPAEGSVTLLSAPGREPSLVSWNEAHAACRATGSHLCTSEEWEDACDGEPGTGGSAYPTPDGGYRVGRCGVSDYREGFRPSLSPTGSWPHCHTPSGAYDLLGNAWEWTDPQMRSPDGERVTDKRGAAHYSGSPATCSFRAVGRHPPDFEGTTGFRCCRDPGGSG